MISTMLFSNVSIMFLGFLRWKGDFVSQIVKQPRPLGAPSASWSPDITGKPILDNEP